jgi:uncharacterized protein YggU (UPF0235/DUF167 family)
MHVRTTQLKVRVQPRSSNPGIGAKRGGTLIVRLKSAPVEDAANKELIAVIAQAAGIAKGKVTIVKGDRSRDKILELDGITEGALDKALQWDA